MLRFTYVIVTIALFAVSTLACERQALAYVDPGSSLVLFQGASSVVMGILFYLRKRIRAMIFGKRAHPGSPVGETK